MVLPKAITTFQGGKKMSHSRTVGGAIGSSSSRRGGELGGGSSYIKLVTKILVFLVLSWLMAMFVFFSYDAQHHKFDMEAFGAGPGGLRLPPRKSTDKNDKSPQSNDNLVPTGIVGPKDAGRECTYEGNCPALTTCSTLGRCVPYTTPGDIQKAINQYQTKTKTTTCIEQCINDANWDERYYFITTANVIGTIDYSSSANEPSIPSSKCIVLYRRNKSKDPQPTTQEWRDHKHNVLVRRDPVIENPSAGDQQIWVAFCYNSCSSDSDCIASSAAAKASFVCVEGSCQRKNHNSQSNYDLGRALSTSKAQSTTTTTNNKKNKLEPTSDLVVLTYANNAYFGGVKELAASLRYWAPHVRLVIYNLGLNPHQIEEIQTSWWNVVQPLGWPNGIPTSYPDHVHEMKVYAWKPILIYEAVQKYKKVMIFDAGSVIRAPLDPLERILEQTGNFVVWGQDTDMMPKAHPSMFKWFHYNKREFVGGPHYSGNTQGYLYPSDSFDKIVIPMYQCALDEKCISPEGSSLGNHRYDQTALSIVSYGFDVMAQPHTEYLAGGKYQLNPDPLQPSEKVVWTARQGSHDYVSRGF